MTFKINQVATCGCEIKSEDGKVIGWSVNSWWAKIIAEALEKYTKEEK